MNAARSKTTTAALALLLVLPAGAAAATSCLVPASQVAGIRDPGEIQQLNARDAVMRPCRGTPAKVSIPVIYSVGGGITREVQADPGAPIAQLIERSLQPGQKLDDIWQKGSILDTLFAAARGERTRLSGTKRLESPGGVPIEGEVLAGRPLRLHLAFHGWDPAQPVSVRVAGRTVSLLPEAGRLLLPAGLVQPAEIVLSQGSRNGRLIGVRADEFDGLATALADLSAEAAGRSAPMRRALLFSGNGLPLNALAELEP